MGKKFKSKHPSKDTIDTFKEIEKYITEEQNAKKDKFSFKQKKVKMPFKMYMGMLLFRWKFAYKDSLISDKVLNVEVVKTVFPREILYFEKRTSSIIYLKNKLINDKEGSTTSKEDDLDLCILVFCVL